MKYEKLFEKGKIGNLTLKNRVVMTAMGTGFLPASGEATEELIRYFEERAKGGVGLIITEVTRVDEKSGLAAASQLCATEPSSVASYVRLTERVHAYGTKIFMQLQHPGNEAFESMLHGNPLLSPSGVPCRVIGGNPKAMTTEEVKDMVNKFVKGAVIAKTAGFDGVELHAAHGYLINQFMSPHTNRRTDQYGGDFYGRMRFISDIILGIRMACGPDFPICVRIGGQEFTPYGLTEEECQHIARYLESLRIAALNISSGTYESLWSIIEPYNRPEGWRKHLAKNIKACVHIPVIAANTVKHPAFAEQLLQEGVSDFVGVARGHLADPQFVNKAKAGDDARVRKCLGCMHCFRMSALGRPIACAVNPLMGRETWRGDDKLLKNGEGKTVAVIGAGPAGMQAAITLAKRGFKPVVFEKKSAVGGSMNLADKAPLKGMITEFIETLRLEMEDLGIEVRLNTPGTVEACKSIDACGVVIAAGGTPINPQVPGIEKAYTYEQVLTKQVELTGKKIAVIGGGLSGLETAEYLSDFDNEVTVFEMGPAVGTTMYRTVTNAVVEHITDNGGKIMTRSMFTAINENGITINNMATGFDIDYPVDAVVIAMGVKAAPELAEPFEAEFDRVVCVGDTINPGNIADATQSGLDKAFVF